MAVKQPGLRGEMNTLVAAKVCVAWVVLVAFVAWTLRAGAVLSCWPRVLGEYWRDHDNNSCCDGNDFIFATHRINSSTNSLQDRQCFSGKKEARERGEKRREAILFVFLLLVCLPHGNFAPRGIHKLSDFTHHFLGKR
jgi:hypothetical protein